MTGLQGGIFKLISLGAAAIFFLSGCENDLKRVEQISAKKLQVPVDRSVGVTIRYSDSAVVKAILKTPELLHFKTDSPYFEMPKGVTVVFYDAGLNESSTVKSDYAISREREKKVELRKNVVATNRRGETFKSEELIWDEGQRRFFSDRLVTITSKDNTLFGNSFWATEDFSYYEIVQSTGDLNLDEEL